MPMNVTELVMEMQIRRKRGTLRRLCIWTEKRMAEKYNTVYLNDIEAVSTIAIDFRADGEVLASTHGDHTVKLTCLQTGRVLKVLVGHSRTPWTVKFNPIDGDILVSGCIGNEVRVWSASKGVCLNDVMLNAAAVSLSFYPSPSLHCVAVASTTCVCLWQYTLPNPPLIIKDHEHSVRCVLFPPCRPDVLIVGVDNESRARVNRSDDFKPLCQLTAWNFESKHIERDFHLTLTRPRILFREVLLHNGLGIAASKCGRFVCGCAMIPRTFPVPVNVLPEAQVIGHNILKLDNVLAEGASSDAVEPKVTSTRIYSWPRRLSSSIQGMKECLSSTTQLDSLVIDPQPTGRCVRARLFKDGNKQNNKNEEIEPEAFDESTRDSVPHLAIALIDTPEPSSSEVEKLVEAPVISSTSLEMYEVRSIHSISFSPSGEFVMMGCGSVSDNRLELQGSLLHPVTCVYGTANPMTLVGIKDMGMDNINVGCFNTVSGLNSVYGTKSGRLRTDQI